MRYLNENTLPHIANYEKTIFKKKKFQKCHMTHFNLGKTLKISEDSRKHMVWKSHRELFM